MRDLSQALEETLTLMDELLSHIHAFDQRRLAFAPPVLDESTGTTWRSEDTQGLRKFVDTIENNAESFRAVSHSVLLTELAGSAERVGHVESDH